MTRRTRRTRRFLALVVLVLGYPGFAYFSAPTYALPPAAPSVSTSTWNSWDVVMQSGSPQGSVIAAATGVTASIEFFESTNNGGVLKGTLFNTFNAGVDPHAFNNLERYWAPGTGGVYPYAGKSTVNRGADTGETNAPMPLAVRDLQLHPPNNPHSTVAAFRAPSDGTYTIANLGLRRVSNLGGPVDLHVFNAQQVEIATLQATPDRAWVTSPVPYTLGNLTAGSYLYFAVERAGDYAWDATEIAWTITADVAPPPTSSIWNSWDVVTQGGSPQGLVTAASGAVATIEFYESTDNGGVLKGALFNAFNAGVHPQAFNNIERYWAPGTGVVYPYGGKSTVNRGADAGETNAPLPLGVRDLQLHPPNNPHTTVAAFRAPFDGTYTIANLGLRRVSNLGGPVGLHIFNPQRVEIATLQAAADRAWVTTPNTYSVANMTAGSYLYFAAERVGDYGWDAAEIAWTITADIGPSSPPAPTCTLTATPPSITEGMTTTLAWTATNATSLTLDQGIGAVTPVAGGSVMPAPATTTTYTATASGPGGVGSCMTTVVVMPSEPPMSSTWNSWDVVTQSGTPQGQVTADVTGTVATVEFYESIDNGGVLKGALFNTFNAGADPQAFNNLEQYWAPGTGGVYPYTGKSTVDRGADTGETNAPMPLGVRDLQLHPPNNPHTTVAAFRAPIGGTYTIANLGLRRVSNLGGPVGLHVFNPEQAEIMTLQATPNRAWVTSPSLYTLVNITAGSYLYFAVERAGDYGWDATEIAWTVTASTGPPPMPTCTLSATPDSITQGTMTTLSWTASNATSLTIDRGVGAVSPVAAGAVSVAPTATTLYTASATGPGGVATCTTTVGVIPSSSTSSIWNSWDVVTQAGNPQGIVTASATGATANVEFYESTDNAGVAKGLLFATFTAAPHPNTFNHVEKYWGATSGAAYPYAGRSTVNRGADSGETNAPLPLGVRDLQLHAPNNPHTTVAAFRIPSDGTYTIGNLGVRRVSNLGGPVGLHVFNAQQVEIATLQATTDQAWVTSPTTYTLVNLSAGSYLYFAVERAGDFGYDATEIAWTVTTTHVGDPFLHVVIEAPPYVVDQNGDGTESVAFVGERSHTHELGRHLNSFTWKDGDAVLATTPNVTVPLAVGTHNIALTIADNNVPPRTLTDSVIVPVYPLTAVGGVVTRYYPTGSVSPSAVIDSLGAQPGFIEVRPTLRIDGANGLLGGSSYRTNVVATMIGQFTAAVADTYEFVPSGGVASRLFLNGSLVSGPLALAAGNYAIEARFALVDVSNLPAQVSFRLNGAAVTPIPASALHHDESSAMPFINSGQPAAGSPFGGETMTIQGFGFLPSNQVTVHWGSLNLTPPATTVTPTTISLTTPPGAGTVNVTVQTPNGLSNSVPFIYSSGALPVSFSAQQVVATTVQPTQAAWGPDGRLYVARLTGEIMVYTFDDNYNVTGTQTLAGVSGLSNPMILGIAFDPSDPPDPVRIYVSHSELFANGGACFSEFSSYSGRVSRLDGPNFSTAVPIITGLPVSNHDHGVNALVFDNIKDLWIAQGGNTNAGVAGTCSIGQLPESPLTAAILKATLSKTGFNGTINYVVSGTSTVQNDQRAGQTVDVAPGVDVSPFATGIRNSFDIVLTTDGNLYSSDNGPNTGFGPQSLSATTQGPDPGAPDEINRVVEGGYYGHPNRNRGRSSVRENVFRNPATTPILGQYTGPLATVPSSSDGIDEYRATTFNSAMRGSLLIQQLDGTLYRAMRNAGGTAVTSVQSMGSTGALDVLAGPGGAIVEINYTSGDIVVLKPSAAGAPATVAYDIFPWRGRADGTTPFVIGGLGFGTLGSTAVTVGGIPAVVTSVSPTRIRGLIPASANPSTALLDVTVQSAGHLSTITQAFRYLPPRGVGSGVWRAAPAMPLALGEVAAGAIDGVIYIVGEGNSGTFAYDLATETWNALPARPFPGDHHAAEVVNGKLYLFGGIGAEGRVQIYNPATNAWSQGAISPVNTGAASTALINGIVYMAGGIAGSSTVNSVAAYNPATNSWTVKAPMPLARNHAAASTDGTRLFIFGGRGPGSGDGNFVAVGFNDVQIYDPATNTWACSCTPGSTIPALPQARGGMGKAAFYQGEFYVIGGETTSAGTGQVAGNVYNRVDVYNPVLGTWRLEAPIPTARHGIFPLTYNGRIYVAGGGTHAGYASSNVVEVFSR